MERPAPLLLIYKHQGASDSVMQWTVMMNGDFFFFFYTISERKVLVFGFWHYNRSFFLFNLQIFLLWVFPHANVPCETSYVFI